MISTAALAPAPHPRCAVAAESFAARASWGDNGVRDLELRKKVTDLFSSFPLIRPYVRNESRPSWQILTHSGRIAENGNRFIFLRTILNLVDTSGRVRPNKRGAIPERSPKLLALLGVELNEWFKQ